MKATAKAHANIALVKYWGKRAGAPAALNLPAEGSLSLTLEALATTTTVEFFGKGSDELVLDGSVIAGPALLQTSRWLDLIRAKSGIAHAARITSANNFPTSSGLASSASAYAALAVAASRAAGLSLSPRELSVLARQGSGSAARSIFGDLVILHRGASDDGSDCFAQPLAAVTDQWPLRMVIAIVGGGAKKKVSSRDAMQHCAETSPLYRGWLESVPGDLAAARRAIDDRDLASLGAVVERSALTMHASALAARPGIVYLQPATLACMHAVHAMRQSGAIGFCTMDAGPHVKVLTLAEHTAVIADALREIAGVTDVLVSGPGGGAREAQSS